MSIINKVYEKIRVKIYQYLFIRNFKTYDEADIFCSRYFSNCYNNNYLNEYRFQKFKLNFNDLPFLNQPQYKCLTEIILLYIKKNSSLPRILDFGGGFGDNYFYIENLLNEKIDFAVCESVSVVEINKKNNNNTLIKYYSDLKLAIDDFKPDIIYSSGTIQYLKNPYEALKTIGQSKSKMVAFSRNSFGKENIYTQLSFLNHHGTGKEPKNFKKKFVLFPHTVIEENLLKNIFSSSYKSIRESKGINAGLTEKEYSKDLIFERVYNDSI